MGDDEARSLRAVHDAFTQRKFVRDWTHTGQPTYSGVLDPTNLKVEVSVTVTDLDFVKPPRVRLVDPTGSQRQVPHILSSDGSVCYFEPKAVVLDRYDPGGTVLQCLDQAEKILRDGTKGRLDADFAEEFISYWGTSAVLIDLPSRFEGPAEVRFLRPLKARTSRAILSTGKSWLNTAHRPDDFEAQSGAEPCHVVRTDRVLTIDPNSPWPPDNLSTFNDWLRWAEPRLIGLLEQRFVESTGVVQWLAVAAANGLFMARITLPPSFRKQEFTKDRRVAMPSILDRISTKVEVERYGGFRADTEYIFRRNMGDSMDLGERQILLIGCGTIGGFLAHQLAEAGAGSGGGKLTLIDIDTLQTANLGRHLLGVPYLGWNKAEACQDFLRHHLPMLDVDALNCDAQAFVPPMHHFDLVVDATGEEAVSIALNERLVRAKTGSPAVLFCWLIGNGAAAQCLLADHPDFACFKCLKPDLSGEPRFRTQRKSVEVVHERNLSCGDTHFVPFPVSRSVAAAALACEAALDWANAKPEPRFRSLTLDRAKAYQVKDGNPLKLDKCPACGSART